jgi:Domain of unknown function (DUF1877)
MSMMARFVPVSLDRLKEILDDPSSVEVLFVSEQAAKAMPKLMSVLGALQGRSPKLFAASMASLHPGIRDRLAQALKNLGIDPDALARGESGDDLTKLMADRMQALGLRSPGQPPVSAAGAQSSRPLASISLDKAWHGVHYLLCGEPDSDSSIAGQAVIGGTEIGDDLGYGPARYFEVSEVADIACELSRPTLEAEMAARFNPDQMTRLSIYPGKWSASDRDWVFDAFRQLRQFYMDASAAGLVVVTCIE